MGNHTQVRAVSSEGDHIQLQQISTDSPFLPVESIRTLHEFRPDLVDFVIEQTRTEAEFRRKEVRKTNRYIFIERISGVFAGALIAAFGLSIGGILIYLNHDAAGATLCGVTLVGIVSVLVTKNLDHGTNEKPKQPARKPRAKAK